MGCIPETALCPWPVMECSIWGQTQLLLYCGLKNHQIHESWRCLTFPFRTGAMNRQHESPESAFLGHRTTVVAAPRGWGLLRDPGPSWVGIIWARINFGSFKMLRSGGAVTTAQPGACCPLRRAAGKIQDTQFSLDFRWSTNNLIGLVYPKWCTDHT